jgi:hypothetical protein
VPDIFFYYLVGLSKSRVSVGIMLYTWKLKYPAMAHTGVWCLVSGEALGDGLTLLLLHLL